MKEAAKVVTILATAVEELEKLGYVTSVASAEDNKYSGSPPGEIVIAIRCADGEVES